MIFFLIAFLPAVLVSGEEDPVVVCNWEPDLSLSPGEIDPFICTHIAIEISVSDILTNHERAAQVTQIMSLKRKNNQLQVLMTIPTFIYSDQFEDILDTLRLYSFDGVKAQLIGTMAQYKTELEIYEQRLKGLKSKLSPGGFIILLEFYGSTDHLYLISNWDKISENTNLISFKWFSTKDKTYLSELNSEDHVNIRFSIDYMVSKGVPKNKLLLGLHTSGYLVVKGSDIRKSYKEICKAILENPDWVVEWNQLASVSMIETKNGTLIYNSQRSFKEKMKFVTDRKLRGVHVYDLNSDDSKGECGQKFPLTSEAKKHFDVGPYEFYYVIQVKNQIITN